MKNKQKQLREEKKIVTLVEKLTAVIAYHNPDNDLLGNLETVGGVLKVLSDRKDEVRKYLKQND